MKKSSDIEEIPLQRCAEILDKTFDGKLYRLEAEDGFIFERMKPFEDRYHKIKITRHFYSGEKKRIFYLETEEGAITENRARSIIIFRDLPNLQVTLPTEIRNDQKKRITFLSFKKNMFIVVDIDESMNNIAFVGENRRKKEGPLPKDMRDKRRIFHNIT